MSYNDINDVRNNYITFDTEVDERNYILKYLKNNTSESKTTFHIKGKPVCRKAWILIHGVSSRRFDRIDHDFKTGSEWYTHGNTGLKRPTSKTAECIAWLSFLVNAIGDRQPDSDKIHLLSCFTKVLLYKKCVKSCSRITTSVNRSFITWIKSLVMSQFRRFVTYCIHTTKLNASGHIA